MQPTECYMLNNQTLCLASGLKRYPWILTCHSLNLVLNLLDSMTVRIKMMLMRKLLQKNQRKMRLTRKR